MASMQATDDHTKNNTFFSLATIFKIDFDNVYILNVCTKANLVDFNQN